MYVCVYMYIYIYIYNVYVLCYVLCYSSQETPGTWHNGIQARHAQRSATNSDDNSYKMYAYDNMYMYT